MATYFGKDSERSDMNVTRTVRQALNAIQSSPIESVVEQIWWFGSTSVDRGQLSNDIDLALFTPSSYPLKGLEAGLRRLFPHSVIHRAGGYTKHIGNINGIMPLHFVLDATMPTNRTMSIRRSILDGACVWDRNRIQPPVWNCPQKTFGHGTKSCLTAL
jgi:hypothetical protein